MLAQPFCLTPFVHPSSPNGEVACKASLMFGVGVGMQLTSIVEGDSDLRFNNVYLRVLAIIEGCNEHQGSTEEQKNIGIGNGLPMESLLGCTWQRGDGRVW
ncbi:uncharacterized protein A4U43_C05F15030 [Asparagus officinalis]|uniref:Uncharacterized protein n=1 Tax=Asparagus officinalis TaxID=4686 RepID=A0A5P1ERP8_ASPOF|nr:uncharacterized protein A4U43_C05F15030 [Asparagus officinalis]